MSNTPEATRPARRSTPRAWLGILALVAASGGLTPAILELGLRLAGYQAISEVYSKPSIFWQRDELLGWSHKPGASGLYVGPRPWPIEFRAPVQINSLGLRGPEPAPLTDDTYRILMMGDSLVAAFEVAYADTFTAVLEKRLDERFEFPVQAINAGVRGYGTDQSYLWWRERGRALEPDLLVFLHSLNDPEDNITLHRMRRPFGKPALAPEPGGGLALRGHPIPRYPLCSLWLLDANLQPRRLDTRFTRSLCWLQLNLVDHSALFSWLTLRIRRNPELLRWLYNLGGRTHVAERMPRRPHLAGWGGLLASGAPGEAPELADRWQLTSAIVQAFHRSVRETGAGFLFIVAENHWERMDRDALRAEGIEPEFMNIHSPMGGALGNRYIRFRNDAHLNETGHGILARELEKLVARRVAEDRGVALPPPL